MLDSILLMCSYHHAMNGSLMDVNTYMQTNPYILISSQGILVRGQFNLDITKAIYLLKEHWTISMPNNKLEFV